MADTLKIGIDARLIEATRNLTGIGRYIFELCRRLEVELPDAEFVLYSQSASRIPGSRDRWTSRTEGAAWARKLKSAAWLKLRAGSLVEQDHPDIFWAAATLTPWLPSTVRRIVTVYDLNYIVAPETMFAPSLWTHRLFFNRDIRSADRILAISLGTKRRLEQILGRTADGVVYPAAGKLFKVPDAAVVKQVLDQYRLRPPYLLAVGTLEPRKNLEMLVDVFLEMRREGLLPDFCLVHAGGSGWKDRRLRGLLGSHPDQLKPLGFVPDEHLPSLYSASSAFVFPSIYEGFGMPALEARLCGAKVLASDIPEIREACGEGAVYVAPNSSELRNGILRILKSPPNTSTIMRAQPSPSWEEGARTMAHHIRELAVRRA